MTFEGVAIAKYDTTESIKSSVLKRSNINLAVLFSFLVLSFGLNYIEVFVLELNISISLILNKLSVHDTTVFELDSATVLATASIVVPWAFINISILVIMTALTIAQT